MNDTNGKYIVAVHLPGNNFWTLHSGSDGEEHERAVERLNDCIESYGKPNAIMLKRLYYTVDIIARPIGFETEQGDDDES